MKKFFSHLSHYEMAVYPMIYSFPLFIAALFFIDRPPVDAIFYVSFLVSLPVNFLGFILYMKAIKISPLSLTIPYLAFTPVFMILTGYVFLDEIPGMLGLLGILMICIGGYVLNLDLENFSFFSPFVAVFNEKGSMIMLFVSFVFSFAATLGKVGILHSSALFFPISFFLAFNLFVFGILKFFKKISVETLLKYKLKGFLVGVVMFFHVLFHGLAIFLTKAAYMMAIKRLSILFSVIYGGIFFKEKKIKLRLAGAVIMVLGSFMILVGK